VGTMLTLGACDTEGKEDTGSKQKSHAKGQASRRKGKREDTLEKTHYLVLKRRKKAIE